MYSKGTIKVLYTLSVVLRQTGCAVLAADQGNAAAQNNLGVCCENGTGVAKDEARAVQLYRLAAAQENQNAIVGLNRRHDLIQTFCILQEQ